METQIVIHIMVIVAIFMMEFWVTVVFDIFGDMKINDKVYFISLKMH